MLLQVQNAPRRLFLGCSVGAGEPRDDVFGASVRGSIYLRAVLIKAAMWWLPPAWVLPQDRPPLQAVRI